MKHDRLDKTNRVLHHSPHDVPLLLHQAEKLVVLFSLTNKFADHTRIRSVERVFCETVYEGDFRQELGFWLEAQPLKPSVIQVSREDHSQSMNA